MNLFKKAKKKKDTFKKPVELFSDNWNFYFQYTTGAFNYSVRYDLAVEKLSEAVKKDYPHMLQINIPFLNSTENGLPTSEVEFPRLDNIEDNFASASTEIRYFARVAGGNVARYLFCYNGFETEKKLQQLVNELVGNLKRNAYSYETIRNDNFATYEQYVLPNNYGKQHMLNRSLCQQLQHVGEVFLTPRDIDFLFVFRSDIHLDKVSANLTEKKFREVRREKMEDGTYHLEFILNAIPLQEYMDHITDDIVDLLENSDGTFDGWGCPVFKE